MANRLMRILSGELLPVIPYSAVNKELGLYLKKLEDYIRRMSQLMTDNNIGGDTFATITNLNALTVIVNNIDSRVTMLEGAGPSGFEVVTLTHSRAGADVAGDATVTLDTTRDWDKLDFIIWARAAYTETGLVDDWVGAGGYQSDEPTAVACGSFRNAVTGTPVQLVTQDGWYVWYGIDGGDFKVRVDWPSSTLGTTLYIKFTILIVKNHAL